MKLLIDGHFLDGRKHGVAVYLDKLYMQYHKLQPDDELHFGLEPHVVVDYQLFNLPRVYVHRYRFGGVLRFIYDIPVLARKIDPDVIHTQYVLPLRIGYTAKRHVTLYDVLYEDFPEHFSLFYRWSRKLIFGLSARQAEIISSISQYSRARIAKLYGRPAHEIHLVYPGVVDDESYTSPPVSVTRENIVLYVSRFEKRKNHLLLLRSLPKLRQLHPGIRVIFVGFEVDGTLARVRDFITRNGMVNAVDILSHIDDSELEILYSTSGVVVYPSFGEGFGMPIIESFLLNPNTLFSNRTAMTEFTFAPNNHFDPTDQSAFTAKMDAALCVRNTQPPEWLAQRRKVIEKYNWSRSAQVLVGLYHKVPSVRASSPKVSISL